LTGNVNFNFFLESYRIWRLQNTDIKHTPELIEKFNFISDYGQEQKGTDNQIVKLKGTGDGKLFVLNTFSPAYWSINEGTILHFATINGDNVTDKFKSFIEWNFNNLQCYDNPRQHKRGYARTYNTLSTSTISLEWVKDGVSNDLIKCIRPMDGNKALWATTTDKWNPNGSVEKEYENIMNKISDCTNLGQMTTTLKNGQFGYDYSSCALVPTANNYNCETYSSMVISMILNTDTFDNVERKFDFNFPGVSDSKNIADTKYTLSQNLMRMYSAYWPVAIYEDGYENGIFESDFNNSNDPNIIADRAEYSKQSMIFQYLFGGLNIEAADATGNPVLKALTELFTMPMINTILGVLPKSASTMAPILNNMMYCIFLYEFLKVETVYLSGYRFNDINNASFDLYKYYDCEPSIYKFKIGTSTKRGVANSKLLLAVFKWITKGRTDLLTNFKLFKDSNLTSEQQQKINDINSKFNNVYKDFNDLISFKPEDCDQNWPVEDCSKVGILGKAGCEYTNMRHSMCSSGNGVKRINFVSSAASNTVDGLLEVIRNRDVTVPLLKELSNFVFEKADIFANIIIGNMQRFTTWCHQNYESNPNIMASKSPNTNYALGNLIRRPDGICKNFGTCSLSDKDVPGFKKFPVNFQTKKLYTRVNNKNILQEDNTFAIIVIVFILVFFSLLVFLGFRTKKNLLSLDQK
jgi:hypothetical protein